MASDIIKGDNLDEFWSFINGDNAKDRKGDKKEIKKEEQSKEKFNTRNISDNNENNEGLKNDSPKPELSKQNVEINRERQTTKVEFQLAKALKTIEDIEAFGSADELDDEFRLSSASEREDDPNTLEKNSTDVWSKKKNDEAADQKSENQQNDDSKLESEKTADLGVDNLGKSFGINFSTFFCGGLLVTLLLSVRLLCVALGTVKDFIEYAAACATHRV